MVRNHIVIRDINMHPKDMKLTKWPKTVKSGFGPIYRYPDRYGDERVQKVEKDNDDPDK